MFDRLHPGALLHLARRRTRCEAMARQRNFDDEERAVWSRLYAHVGRVARPFLDHKHFPTGTPGEVVLAHLVPMRSVWLRPIEAWRPRSDTFVLTSLLTHLFAKWPVPAFVESAFASDVPTRDMVLYPHLGQGRNIRAFFVDFPLSKRAAHVMTDAPEDFTITQALRRAQVLGVGGSERLADAVSLSFLRNHRFDRQREEFWTSVFQWIVRQDALRASSQVGPLLDYLQMCKERDPDFSMKGRGAKKLVDDMERWHRAMYAVRRPTPPQAPDHGLSGFQGLTGEQQGRAWRVVEITDVVDLWTEGKTLRHCVASYAARIEGGTCAIFSLRMSSTSEAEERLVTIEVDRARKTVVQARGFANRNPTAEEMAILRTWAAANRLGLSRL
jgi:hypothetical protein